MRSRCVVVLLLMHAASSAAQDLPLPELERSSRRFASGFPGAARHCVTLSTSPCAYARRHVPDWSRLQSTRPLSA